MPELPEVTALAEALSARTADLRVARVEVAAISALKTFDPPVSAVAGCEVLGCSRLGKHLVLELVDPQGEPLYVVIHLSRAGWARWRDDPPAAPAPFGRRGGGRGAGSALALRIVFGAGARGGPMGSHRAPRSQRSMSPRRAPRSAWPSTWSAIPPRSRAWPGSAPTRWTTSPPSCPRDPRAAGRTQIKGVLRDQTIIAGIGNAYSDEILHAARMSPFTPAGTLTPEAEVAAARRHAATRWPTPWPSARAPAGDLKAEKKSGLRVHGRTGEPCPVCGDTVREVSLRRLALQYCPTCQTGGKPLADRRMSRLLK